MSPGVQRHTGGHRDRLLARGLDVEGDAALALDALHSVIEQTRQQHVPQAHLQFLGLEVRIPGTYGTVIIAQHPHHLHRQVLDVAHTRLHVGTVDRSGRGDLNIAEVRLLARAGPEARERASATVGS